MNKLLLHIIGIAIIGTGVATGAAAIAQSTNANGIVVRESYNNFWSPILNTRRIEVFVNQPTHNAEANTYNKSNVPFSYRVVWGVCGNVPTSVRVITRYATTGGLFTNVEGDANTQWKTIGNEVYTGVATCGQHACLVSRSSATRGINMSDVSGDNTTLQVIAKWHNTAVPDSSIPENPDIYASYYAHTVVNVHLRWGEITTTTPTPTVTTPPPICKSPTFSCGPATQTVDINETVRVYEDPSQGMFQSTWTAPGAQIGSGTGTEFTTSYATVGNKTITARSVDFPGGQRTSTCTVRVVANPNANRPPVAVAKMSIDNGPYSSTITVTQNKRVNVRITAGEHGSAGSFDPDGWDTAGKGVSVGSGKIEWNNNLYVAEPRYEKTFTNPATPNSADMNLGDKIFTLSPGTYTYNLLKITDAAGAVSNTGAVSFTVLPDPNTTTPPTPIPSPGDFQETR